MWTRLVHWSVSSIFRQIKFDTLVFLSTSNRSLSSYRTSSSMILIVCDRWKNYAILIMNRMHRVEMISQLQLWLRSLWTWWELVRNNITIIYPWWNTSCLSISGEMIYMVMNWMRLEVNCCWTRNSWPSLLARPLVMISLFLSRVVCILCLIL